MVWVPPMWGYTNGVAGIRSAVQDGYSLCWHQAGAWPEMEGMQVRWICMHITLVAPCWDCWISDGGVWVQERAASVLSGAGVCTLTLLLSTLSVCKGNVNHGAHAAPIHPNMTNGTHQHLQSWRVPIVCLLFGRCFNSENRFSSQIVWVLSKPQLFFCAPR